MNEELSPIQLIWGNEVLDAGFTPLPNIVTRYALRFIDIGEFSFITVLCSYKHSASDPFPKQKTIAKDMNTTERQIRKYVQRLGEKGFLEVEYIYKNNLRVTSAYNFSALVEKCLEVHRAEQLEKDIAEGTKKIKKVVRKSVVPTTGLKSPVPIGSESPVPIGLESPVPTGRLDPLIIDKVLIDKSLINKLKKQTIYDEELELIISKTLKDFQFKEGYKEVWLEGIFELYNLYSTEINLVQMKSILIELSQRQINSNFKAYLQKMILSRIESLPKLPAEPIRKELLPDWFDKPEKEKKEMTPLEREIFLQKKQDLEERLKKYFK